MSGPFSKIPLPGDIDDFRDFGLDSRERAEMAGMMSLVMDDMRENAEGGVAPDTRGVAFCFTYFPE